MELREKPSQNSEPADNLVRMYTQTRVRAFVKISSSVPTAGRWSATRTVRIRPNTSRKQKKVKTIAASELNSDSISPGALRIFAQLRKGLISQKIANAAREITAMNT